MENLKKKNLVQYKIRRVLLIILLLNILVLIAKIFAGISTLSLSILSDAAHSGIDSINNIAGLIVLKFASQPPDKEHPYGHEKFETLTAFGILIFLTITFLEILRNSINRLVHPVELPLFKIEILWILALTLIVNLFVWIYERKQGRLLNSDLLIADSSHTGVDVLITFSVIVSQFFIAKKMFWIDPVIAMIISILILKAGIEIFKRTVPILVDQAWLDPKEIKTSVLKIKNIVDCYDIYSRKGPYSAFIECKIKVCVKELYEAHSIADEVEKKLKQDFGRCKITVHVEP